MLYLTAGAQKNFNWTGFYIGPNLGGSYNTVKFGNLQGYGVSAYDANFNPISYDMPEVIFQQISGIYVPQRGVVIVPGTERSVNGTKSNKINFTGGIQIGYRKSIKKWVGILEADFNYQHFKGNFDYDDSLPATALTWTSPFGFHHMASTNFTESIRVRWGYPLKNSLIYLTAGAVFTTIKTTALDYDRATY